MRPARTRHFLPLSRLVTTLTGTRFPFVNTLLCGVCCGVCCGVHSGRRWCGLLASSVRIVGVVGADCWRRWCEQHVATPDAEYFSTKHDCTRYKSFSADRILMSLPHTHNPMRGSRCPRCAQPDRWRPRPFDAHVNPIGGGLGGLPTTPPIGFSCVLKG